MKHSRPSRRCTVAAAVVLSFCASFAVLAADDNPAAKRDREQLQRTRSALKEATAQRDALQTEKAAWDAERQRLMGEATRSKGSERVAAALRKQVAACETQSQQQTQELTALRSSLAQTEQQAQEREAALRLQLQGAERTSSERAAAVRATTQLLERSTATLARAEAANLQMHAAALQALETLRREWQAGQTLLLDPLGLAAVRQENALASLREALEKARLTPAP
jgi:phage-related minor tail protein